MSVKKISTFILVVFLAACVSCSMIGNKQDVSVKGNVASSGEENPAENEKTPKITEFILGSGDIVDISVYRRDELSKTLRIDYSGKVMYPLVGDIQAAGLSIFQLRDKITQGLSPYIIDPQVSVAITAIHSQKIMVLGEVTSPGFFQADEPMTIVEAISRAGGFTIDGKKKSVLVIRGGLKSPQLIKVNVDDILNGSDKEQNIVLVKDDIIYVPRTTISNISLFFSRLSGIISPLLQLETGYFIGQQIDEGPGKGGSPSVSSPGAK